MNQRFSIVCLSSQEWRVDLPTNRQQVMLRAARRGHEVLFVETGSFVARHLSEAAIRRDGSVWRRLVGSEDAEPGVRVRKAPNLLPWGKKYRLSNAVNRAVTAAMLRRVARRLPKPVVLWIYDPTFSGLAGHCDEAFAVYDCVDDYVEQNGGDARRRALLASADERAANVSRLVFATSRTLYDRQRRLNEHTHLVPNGGDYEHFRPAADPGVAAAETKDLAHPVIGFAGNLTSAKVDFALLEKIACAKPDWTLLLVGPVRREAEAALASLRALPNVRWLGEKPYGELPRYIAAFDVALIPYVSSAYTRSCFPLKLYEYLAAGKPIVASGVPELAGMEPDVVVTESVPAFVAAVEEALSSRSEADRERRFALASRNTWDTRTGRLLDLIAEELPA
jgi:glycosyltransferase involved in cell wall biosynthesis